MLELLILIGVVGLDQVSKYLSADILPTLEGGTFPIIQDVLHLTYAENRGAAFGMLQDMRWFFIIMTLLLSSLIAYLLIKKRSKLHTMLRISLALILSGAIGNNLIDRLIFGYVRDMIDFRLINFAVFNVADSAICVGAALLCIDIFFCKKGRAMLEELDEWMKKKPAKEKKID